MKINDFDKKYSEILNAVKDDIKVINSNLTSVIDIRDPLASTLKDYLSNPSKRIRPLLALLYTRAKNISVTEQHYKFLTAVELIHNASLIHDDIIDDDSIRRNKKSLNSELDNKLAVISGDYILSLAMSLISDLQSIELVKLLSLTLKEMCFGEINQHYNKFQIPTIEDYILKSEQKTAKLFDTAIKGCLILSSKTDSYDDFGSRFGTAFQIRNDLIDITSENPDDIEEGIYNAPVIFSQNKDDLSGGIENTCKLIDYYLDSALESINCLEDNIYCERLKELVELFRYE